MKTVKVEILDEEAIKALLKLEKDGLIKLVNNKQNSFGCFGKNRNFKFSQKDPKLFCLYLRNQISLRGCFVFKTTGRISFIFLNLPHHDRTSKDLKEGIL